MKTLLKTIASAEMKRGRKKWPTRYDYLGVAEIVRERKGGSVMMRPGRRYKIAWAVYGVLCLAAGMASMRHPEHQAMMVIGLVAGWGILCYVTFRQAPEPKA